LMTRNERTIGLTIIDPNDAQTPIIIYAKPFRNMTPDIYDAHRTLLENNTGS